MGARLITEDDVRSGLAGDPIVIERGVIITPSALDRARLMGVSVIFQREEPASRREVGEAAAWPDGRYLVTVSNGVTRIHRLDDDGPRPFSPPKGPS